jgi:nucleotide-binding universal stress UspA family protein
MYKKVIVPLDGSKLAELALPHLEEIAKGCSIPEILLISVTEKIKGRIPAGQYFEEFVPEKPVPKAFPTVATTQVNVIMDDHNYGAQEIPASLGKMARTAADYLCNTAACLEQKGFRVSTNVAIGEPAEQIVRFVNEQRADLIIMASTGKSRISRWDMNTIADKVIKETHVPVLLIKPPAGFKETKPKRKGVAL